MLCAMLRTTIQTGLLSIPLVLGATGAAVAQSQIPPVIHEEFPFSEMLQADGDRLTLDPSAIPDLFYKVSTDVQKKQVTLSWHLRQPGQQSGNDIWRATSTQVEACSFWPTAVAPVSATEIVVAGYDRRGITRIERWTVTLPSIVVDLSGKERLRTHAVTRSEVLLLHEAGKEAVCVMTVNRGEARSVLLQFWDSRDVYRLDVDTAALTLQVSSTQHPTAPYLSQLADAYLYQVWSGDHVAHGYTYLLMNIEDRMMPIALFDNDRDGTIDDALSVDAATSLSMGLHDGTLYQ